MNTILNNPELEKHILNAIEKEKEIISRSNRVDQIMDKVMELSLQASYETRWMNLKTAFLYGFSIAVSINIGCIIGNLVEISTVSQSIGLDFISIGFGGIFLTV